jgi:hypothetical protein
MWRRRRFAQPGDSRNATRGAARRNAHPSGLHKSAPTRSWPIICGCELAAVRKLRRVCALAAGERRRRRKLRPTTRRGSRAPGTAVHTRRRRAARCACRRTAQTRACSASLAETAHSAALPPLLRVCQRLRGQCVAASSRGVRRAPQRPRRASPRGRASPLSALLVSHDEERRWRAPGVDAAGACVALLPLLRHPARQAAETTMLTCGASCRWWWALCCWASTRATRRVTQLRSAGTARRSARNARRAAEDARFAHRCPLRAHALGAARTARCSRAAAPAAALRAQRGQDGVAA